ncbi:unnamed protein product [Mytilus coruscus]|uniref:Uncharacterized protein n=1 Tax=Mytilus coruscus TaxID=42192 RepID=A0A6J8AE68_MYTCO|nr:unnamed protein product [Mytilus coruscus]
MTKMKPSTDEERMTKTTLLTEGDTIIGTKTPTDDDTMTRMNPSTDDYTSKRTKTALYEVDEDITDSDEERVLEFFAAAVNISSESTDEAFIAIESRGNIENDILKRLETDGVIATTKFLMVQAMKWKRAKVKIAVAGQSSAVPTTDDEWLVRQLQGANIPFCFVRTKLDQDIESGKRMGKSEKTVLNDIIEAIAKSTKTMPVLKDEQVFIISNHKPSLGDMSKLVKFMQQKVTTVKFEAILFSIPAFTEEIIEKKYRGLLDRIPQVAYLHAMYFDNLRTLE